MSTSAVIGDLTQLTTEDISFNAVFTTPPGSSGHGHYSLSTATGLASIISGRSFVEISSGSLTVEISGPASAAKAGKCTLAVVPSGQTTWPTTAHHIRAIGGSTVLKDSLYTSPQSRSLKFATNVAHTLEPKPLVGAFPEVVYFYEITGGAATDTLEITISGEVSVRGVGFIQSW
jgi:hypothetical protein